MKIDRSRHSAIQTMVWLGYTWDSHLCWDPETDRRCETALSSASIAQSILKHPSLVHVSGNVRLMITEAISITHLRQGYSMIPFTSDQQQRITDLAGSIYSRMLHLHSTTSDVQRVLNHVHRIFKGHTPIYEQVDEPQGDHNTPPLPGTPDTTNCADLTNPKTLKRRPPAVKTVTPDARNFRADVMKKTKEARATCRTCDPPRKLASNTIAERHRIMLHKLPQFKHRILCAGCLSEKTVGFITHLCVGTADDEKARRPCPGCKKELPNPALSIHTYDCPAYETSRNAPEKAPPTKKPKGRPKTKAAPVAR
jgi:hypothetical protein